MSKRIISLILCLMMLAGMFPAQVFAAPTDGLCPHHTVHDATCGYAPAVPAVCAHYSHDGFCGYVDPVAEQPCYHDCSLDANCVAAGSCTHFSHDAVCGYAPAVAGAPCYHVCDAAFGCTAAVAEQPCQHIHDGLCGYAPAVPAVCALYSHEGGTATCIAQAQCALCGEFYGELGGHSYVDGLCSLCGATDPDYVAPICSHSYADGVCTLCGADDPNYIAPVPVSFNCTPADLSLSVYVTYEETVPVQADGTYLLMPGYYAYCASCEGYTGVEFVPFEVVSSSAGMSIDVTLEEIPTEPEIFTVSQWSWVDPDKMIVDGEVALPGTNADIVAQLSDVIALLPATINSEYGELAISWSCPDYPAEGAYEGTYIFTATLPEGYILAEGAAAMTLPVILGGAMFYDTYKGSCGTNLTWELDSTTGVLTISGTGAMAAYHEGTRPWVNYKDIIKSVVVNQGVTSIGENAFYGCKNLSQITLPDSVTDIGKYAFYSCSILTNINLPGNVANIGASAFADSGLTAISIPSGTKSIGAYAFLNCSSLSAVSMSQGLLSIGSEAFFGCENLGTVTIPDSVTEIGVSAFYDCYSLESVKIPSGLSSINNNLFSFCTSLKSITIPKTIKSIGNCAFVACNALTTIVFEHESSDLLTLGSEVFSTQSSVNTAINVPDEENIHSSIRGYDWAADNRAITINEKYLGVGDCGENLLWTLDTEGMLTVSGTGAMTKGIPSVYKDRVKNVVISSGITGICGSAFSYCSNMSSVVIPCSVTSIGDAAFWYCTSLTDITFEHKSGEPLQIGQSAFQVAAFTSTTITVPVAQNVNYSIKNYDWTSSNRTKITYKSLHTSHSYGSDASSLYFCSFCGVTTYFNETPAQIDTAGNLLINAVNFPDTNFRNYISDSFDSEGLGCLGTEQTAVTTIDCSYKNIASLKGIEYFTALETLSCYGNTLTSLDVSKNTALTSLNCSNTALTSLDVSGFTKLTNLEAVDCPTLTSLNVSGCTALKILDCAFTALTSLDVSGCNALTNLHVYDCPTLTSLNVSGCTALTYLICSNTTLTSLDVSGCASLTNIEAYDCSALTSLNVSGCTALQVLYCFNTALTNLDLGDCASLISLDCSNSVLTTLDLSNNTKLVWLECSYTPLTALDVSKNIALKEIVCSNCNLTALDVSNNTALTNLQCGGQTPTVTAEWDGNDCVIDMGTSGVGRVTVSSGGSYDESTGVLTLTGLADDATSATVVYNYDTASVLEDDAMDVTLTVEIPDNTHPAHTYGDATATCYCTYCEETTMFNGSHAQVDIDGNLLINEANFPSANFRETILSNFDTVGDAYLSVEQVAEIKVINCADLAISSLKGIEYFTSLEELYCAYNSLTALNVSKNTALTTLSCTGNRLTALDISNNAELTVLYCSANALTALNCSNNPSLTVLDCSTNRLAGLNVTNNPALQMLNCSKNSIAALDLASNSSLIAYDCAEQLVYGSARWERGNLEFDLGTVISAGYMQNVGAVICKSFDRSTGIATLTPPEQGAENAFVTYIYDTKGCLSNRGMTVTVKLNVPQTSGSCGENLTWMLDEEGMLTVSGTGEMYAFSTAENVPWHSVVGGIKSIYIENGVTSIGDYAFSSCSELTRLVIPDCVTCIGNYSFSNCGNMREIVFKHNSTDSLTIAATAFTLLNSTPTTVKVPDAADIHSAICGYDWESNGRSVTYASEGVAWGTFNGSPAEVDSEGNLLINDVNFPSANFRETILSNFDTVGDAYLSVEQVAEIKVINCADLAISSLKGIEYFTSLEELYCSYNSLTALDVSKNTALTTLSCTNNQLTALDISNNAELTVLYCSVNALTALSCSGNPSLTVLDCSTNRLAGLNVANNPALQMLNCSNNSIAALDLASNSSLIACDCANQTVYDNAYWNEGFVEFNLGDLMDPSAFQRVSSVRVGYFDDSTGVVTFDSGLGVQSIFFAYSFDTGISFGNNQMLVNVGLDVPPISGKCGENLSWTMDESWSQLIISGTGEMYDYSSTDRAPWYYYNGIVRDVKIESGVSSIGDYAFYDCEFLTDIAIADSVTQIGKSAFSYCNGLSGVVIPDSVTSIGTYAFSNCSALTSVRLPAHVTTIEGGVFAYCSSLQRVAIPEGVVSIGNYAFSNCSGMTSLIMPDSVESIGREAFRNCSSLKSVTIPDGVTYIENNTFSGCSSLTSVIIPDTVTDIDYSAFKNCSSLTSVIIPDSVTSIKRETFSGCTGLISITIPESVGNIGYEAFRDCSNLPSVTIPRTVASIDTQAFYRCSNLTEINFEHESTDSLTIGTNAFMNDNKPKTVTIVRVPDTTAINAAITGYFWGGSLRTVTYESLALKPWLIGDVNNDGVVESGDALQIQRYLLKLPSVFDLGDKNEKANRLTAANVSKISSGDDVLTADDAYMIQCYAAGVLSGF